MVSPTLRLISLLCAAISLPVVTGVGSFARYKLDGAPGLEKPRFAACWFAPTAHRARLRTAGSLREALAALDAGSIRRGEPVESFPSALTLSEVGLSRALRATPVDSRSMQLLASVRWERENLADAGSHEETLRLIELAAARSPRIPDVRLGIAQTLYSMGNPDLAAKHLATTLTHSPGYSHRVVRTMLSAGVAVAEIAATLPPSAELLIALKEPMLEAGQGDVFLARVEGELPGASPRLLELYGEACLQLGQPARLTSAVQLLPTSGDPRVRAERACQRGYGFAASGDATAAIRALREAQRESPSDPRYAEILGQLHMKADSPRDAEVVFRTALDLLAHTQSTGARRARAYTGLGTSLEAQLRTDEAYDAYRRALALDPGASAARRRIEALTGREASH